LEERRTQAVMSRRWLDADQASDLGRLDEAAIVRVRDEAWPLARNADELHEVLMQLHFLTPDEIRRWPEGPDSLVQLERTRRATKVRTGTTLLHIATECVPLFRALRSDLDCEPKVVVPPEFANQPWTREDALIRI